MPPAASSADLIALTQPTHVASSAHDVSSGSTATAHDAAGGAEDDIDGRAINGDDDLADSHSSNCRRVPPRHPLASRVVNAAVQYKSCSCPGPCSCSVCTCRGRCTCGDQSKYIPNIARSHINAREHSPRYPVGQFSGAYGNFLNSGGWGADFYHKEPASTQYHYSNILPGYN